MFAGTLVMENTILVFTEAEEGKIQYTVQDTLKWKSAVLTVDGYSFFKAVAIAIHPDGEPNAEKDYPAAESVMPSDSKLRWIP